MDVYRVTDSCKDIQNRETYKLLEKINTFTLLECRNAKDLVKMDKTNTLVLDHFDETHDPSSLLKKILNSQPSFSTIILVDSDSNFATPVMSTLDIQTHIIFNSNHDEPHSELCNADKQDLLVELIHRRKEMAA
jgi:hypothetical protein